MLGSNMKFTAKKISLLIVPTLLLTLTTSQISNAQFVEDALRFINPNSVLSARTGALGYAYFGFSDDASAISYNPAGLTLVPSCEMALGTNFSSNSTTTNFLDNQQSRSEKNFYFTNVQFVIPSINNSNALNVRYGFAYCVENDFDANSRYNGYNRNNTFIAQQAAERREWTYETYLADIVNGIYITGINKDIQQDGFITEKGGLHNLAWGAAIDFFKNFTIGGTLIAKIGSYDFRRSYFENDINNVHNENPNDLNILTVKDRLTQDIAGLSGIIGFQARDSKTNMRFGLAIKFPTLLSISERWSSSYEAEFDPFEGKIDVNTFNTGEFSQDYMIITPAEYSFGFAGNAAGLSYSLSLGFKDVSNASFISRSENKSFEDLIYFDDLNEQINNNLTGQFIIGAGLEYKIPTVPIYARGSYTLITSPYKSKEYASNEYAIGMGVGMLFTDNFIFDCALVYSNHTERRANYGNASNPSLYSYYTAEISPMKFLLGFRVRF